MTAAAITWPIVRRRCCEDSAFIGAHNYIIPFIERFNDWPSIDELNQVSKELRPDFQWVFVEQSVVPRRAKSRGDASLSGYVALIGTQGKIPVRQRSLHDFLNCLSFLIFPMSKLQLNLRHFQESPNGLMPGENRTRTQDLLTVFDEGGVIRLKDNKGDSVDLIFGHAIYEHLLKGQKVRAARIDFTTTNSVTNQNYWVLNNVADQLFADWLKNSSHCQSSHEFSNVWLEPNFVVSALDQH